MGYPDRLPDGREVWVNDDGGYQVLDPNRPGAQPLPGPNVVSAPSGGGLTYAGRDLNQMRNELRGAGYNGPWDDQSVYNAFKNVVNDSGAGGGGDWSNLWGALTNTNQQQFDWSKEQFNRELAERQRQFDTSSYSNLAQALLGTAAQLRGPADWLSYANYTSGAGNLFKALFGDKALPTFSAPGGYSEPATIGRLLEQLGIGGATAGGGAPTGGGVPAGDDLAAMAAYVLQKRPDVVSYYNAKQGWDLSTPQGQLAAVQRWLRDVAPNNDWSVQQYGTRDLATMARQMGYQPPQPAAPDQMVKAFEQAAAPVTATNVMVPLPYQNNPAVWDSLSDTAKTMILAAAQAGKTPSGAWEPADYLNQLNAARPQGVAPRRTQFQWGNQALF